MSNKTRARVRTSDTAREQLIREFDTYGLPWRRFALLPGYWPVPAGTLCAIYNGAEIPKKHYKHFGITPTKPAPVCSVCGEVHLRKSNTCPDSAKTLDDYKDLWAAPVYVLRNALDNRS